MKIMIHTCSSRKWYVNKYLVPSLSQQGIEPTDISIYCDEDQDGNLKSTLKSFDALPKNDCIWHLQDDVILASNFKDMMEDHTLPFDYSVVCGFCSIYDKGPAGEVYPKDMWYSFQCIKIDNKLAHEFVAWVQQKDEEQDGKYFLQISNNMFDDYLFKSFMEEKYPDMEVLNLAPNMVDHIDYLIGGSTLVKRKEKMVSRYFEEPELVEELKNRLM